MSAELARAADLLGLLERACLGGPDAEVAMPHHGRNDTWSGTTTTGARVFAKRAASPGAVERALRFERLAPAGISTPRLLAHTADLLVFALIDGDNANDLASRDDLRTADAERIGVAVAALHNAGSGTPDAPMLPGADDLRCLSLSSYVAASSGELALWSLIQPDAELHSALDTLRAHPVNVVARPIHGDLRLDQIVVADGRPWLTDWEEFRFGDPARDIGAFVGEWLMRAVIAVSDKVDELSHARFLARFSEELERLRPFVHAFRDGYRQTGTWNEAQCVRSVAYAGWHLVERLSATATVSVFLTPFHRAAAGIGRTAVLSPDRFIAAMGLR